MSARIRRPRTMTKNFQRRLLEIATWPLPPQNLLEETYPGALLEEVQHGDKAPPIEPPQ